MALCAVLFTACTGESLKGETWHKTRVVEGARIDSAVVEMVFTGNSEGEQADRRFRIILPDEFRPYDSICKDRDTVYPFEYDYSNGTGIARFKDGRILEFNVRNDKLIMQGVTYNKR